MQNTNNSAFPLMISIVVLNADQLRSVYALLGGAAIAVAQSAPAGNVPQQPQRIVQPGDDAQPAIANATVGNETVSQASPASAGTGETATSTASPSDDSGEVDAHGHPWSADLHASTKTKTKDGLWRMKVGVTRPDPLPGFPVDSGEQSADTGTSSEPGTTSATSQTAPEPASAPAATSNEEDDEFAAFRAAAAASDATDAAAAASVPARQYSDADLGALCNQAAVKLGDPNPVKEIIARYVPEGQVAHSRNIPIERRTEFVKEVEAKAGIEFAG